MPRPPCFTRWLVAVSTALLWTAVGCAPAAKPAAAPKLAATHDHDHHDHHDHGDQAPPESLAEGIARIEAAAAAVKKHFQAKSNDAADEVVHGMGHLLEDVQGLLPKEKLSAEAAEAVQNALDEIFDCFDKLDTALHAPEGKGEPPADVHASVAERIEAAIKTIKEAQ